jgi:hypothetical protein
MTCPECHTKMCYVCKQQIKDYSHFDQTPAGQAQTNSSRMRGQVCVGHLFDA